jgi:hypothetical protein
MPIFITFMLSLVFFTLEHSSCFAKAKSGGYLQISDHTATLLKQEWKKLSNVCAMIQSRSIATPTHHTHYFPAETLKGNAPVQDTQTWLSLQLAQEKKLKGSSAILGYFCIPPSKIKIFSKKLDAAITSKSVKIHRYHNDHGVHVFQIAVQVPLVKTPLPLGISLTHDGKIWKASHMVLVLGKGRLRTLYPVQNQKKEPPLNQQELHTILQTVSVEEAAR